MKKTIEIGPKEIATVILTWGMREQFSIEDVYRYQKILLEKCAKNTKYKNRLLYFPKEQKQDFLKEIKKHPEFQITSDEKITLTDKTSRLNYRYVLFHYEESFNVLLAISALELLSMQ